MKSILLGLFLLPLSMLAQNVNEPKAYLDSLWNEATEANHKYYRIIESYDSTTELYNIKDFYKSGVLQMEGHSKTKDDYTKEGEVAFYYENGNKKSKTNYIKSRLIGRDEQWYENGLKKSEGQYFESQTGFLTNYKMDQYWTNEGKQIVTDGAGLFEIKNDKFSDSGTIKNGLKEGEWTGTYNTNCTYTENYKEREIVSGISKDADGNKYTYTLLETKPEPIKGINDFYKHIGRNFRIPKEYKSQNGKIYTTFIVDKNGEIVEPKTIKSLNETLDQEAIRVISSYEKWIPAKQRGQYVRVLYSLPITLSGRN
jgi:antitoxin component YwqK of YwqJK toxin-antitoxin module